MPVALPVHATSVVWNDRDEFVRVEPQDDPAAPKNDHPAEISAQEIATMLGSLQIDVAKRRGDPLGAETDAQVRPVFTGNELRILGEALSKGLERATPREDVTFMTMGTHDVSTGGFLRKRQINAGRVFYGGGKLNVIFGEIRTDQRSRNVYGQKEPWRELRPGMRTAAAEQRWQLVPGSGAEFYRAANGARNDWVVIDTAAPRTSSAPQQAAAVTVVAADTEVRVAGGSERSIEERLALLQDLAEKGLIMDEVYRTKVTEILDEDLSTSSLSIEERLTILRDVWKAGVISEEDYRSRVNAVLEEL